MGLKIFDQKAKKNDKNFDPQKFLGGGVPGSVAWWIMVGTMNVGPHTHLELCGPSAKLTTIFWNFGQYGVGHYRAP